MPLHASVAKVGLGRSEALPTLRKGVLQEEWPDQARPALTPLPTPLPARRESRSRWVSPSDAGCSGCRYGLQRLTGDVPHLLVAVLGELLQGIGRSHIGTP